MADIAPLSNVLTKYMLNMNTDLLNANKSFLVRFDQTIPHNYKSDKYLDPNHCTIKLESNNNQQESSCLTLIESLDKEYLIFKQFLSEPKDNLPGLSISIWLQFTSTSNTNKDLLVYTSMNFIILIKPLKKISFYNKNLWTCPITL